LPRRLALWIAAGLSAAVTACSLVPSDPSFDSVTGSIVQSDSGDLLPGSVVVVRLEDRTRYDGRADILAEQRIETQTQLPIAFRLKYDGGEIDPEHRYVVTASVYAGNQVIYATEMPPNVITEGSPRRIRLVLGRAPQAPPLHYIAQ
jgi:putative lipoprotein